MASSVLNKNEVSRAQVGPRELKDPRSKDYAIQTLYALKRYSESLRCDQERVAKELAEIERYRHWEILGYPSKEALFEAELTAQGRANVEKVKAAVAAAPDLQPEGRPKKLVSHTSLPTGVSSARLAARLKKYQKDYPEFAARIEAGEFKSIRAAAKAAGIVRDKTILEQLRHLWMKATHDDRAAFRDWVSTR